ncbi:MAG: DUF5916 domain-containing protein, partial [Gemmatimonadales bacterium]
MRWRGRTGEWYGWVSHNNLVNPANSGKLEGLVGLNQGLGLDLVPGIRIGQRKDFNASQSSTDLEPSVDVFYKLTSALTAAITVNTDFSGTGADARQINLSRFGLFFPERRDFFLQDTDIFEFGRIGSAESNFNTTIGRVERESGRPFFSRRIGLTDSGETIDLDIGGKLTGRIGRWDIGLLDIRQAGHAAADSSNLFVGRAAARIFAESMLGLIVTDGDPESDRGNTLVGLDFRYLNTRLANGGAIEGAIWYQQTDTEGVDGDDAAFGVSFKMPNGQGFRGGIGFKELQAGFNPALGFVNRSGVRDYTLEFGHTWRPGNDRIRLVYSGVDAQRIDRIEGALQSQRINVRIVEFETSSSEKMDFRFTLAREQVVEPFEISEGIFIPPGLYVYDFYCIGSGTGPHRRLAADLWVCDGGFYSGDALGIFGGLIWRPSPHLSFDARYSMNDVELPQGDFITRLVSLRANVAFTSTWSWENFIQYDNVSDSLGLNSILRWVPRAGREMVL